jgi:hypothetical protein
VSAERSRDQFGAERIVVPVELSDGWAILAEVRPGDREEEVAWHGLKLGELTSSVKGVVRDLMLPLSETKCDRITLEFGLDLALEEGKLTSLLVSGSASASVKVAIEWKRSGQSD